MRLSRKAARLEWLVDSCRWSCAELRYHLEPLIAALWDWHVPEEDEEKTASPLPPVSKGALVAALRVPIDCTLGRAADVINAGAPGRLIAQTLKPVHLLFVDLLEATLATALRLRREAAGAGLPVRSDQRDSMRAPPTDWPKLVCGRWMESIADAIKDAVLDLGAERGRNSPAVFPPLPPLSRKGFILAMRPAVVAALRRITDFVNEWPDHRFVTTEDRRIYEVLLKLVQKALSVGVAMRADAVEARPPVSRFSHAGRQLDGWARKYRLMAVGGPEVQLRVGSPGRERR